MTFDLALTPAGQLIAIHSAEPAEGVASSARSPTENNRLLKAFAAGSAEGLFSLATQRLDGAQAASVTYWRELASKYLIELCHTPDIADVAVEPIVPPSSGDLATMLLSAPPMQGAEYLTEAVIVDLWNGLDQWVREQVASAGNGLTTFLKERAALPSSRASLFPSGREQTRSRLSVCLSRHLCSQCEQLRSHPISAAEQSLAGICRGEG